MKIYIFHNVKILHFTKVFQFWRVVLQSDSRDYAIHSDSLPLRLLILRHLYREKLPGVGKIDFSDLNLQWAIILSYFSYVILISVFDVIKVCKCKVNWTLRNNYIASSLLYIRIYSYWWIKNHNYLATFRHKTSDWYTTDSV